VPPSWEDPAVWDLRPAEAAELRVRYAAAAPLIAGASMWADLGCRDGSAPGAAGLTLPPRVVLVDDDDTALRAAKEAVGDPAETLRADLGEARDLEAVRAAVSGVDGLLVTCFGTLDRVRSFVALVDLLGELAEGGATVVLDVPDDAFAGRAGGPRIWGLSAFEELRRLLPSEPVMARQIALAGSAVVPAGEEREALDLAPVTPGDQVATHLIAAFGPNAGGLVATAHAEPADRAEARRRSRERDADLAYFEAKVARAEGR
jgi:hypothetical protein